MPTAPPLNPEILALAASMEAFEASESVANTGTGARREGAKFELLASELWRAMARLAAESGATATELPGAGTRWYSELGVQDRKLLLPLGRKKAKKPKNSVPPRWVESDFGVTELVQSYPGLSEATTRYAPTTGPFAKSKYPDMFRGLSTEFDDSIVLVEAGVLREKVLLEYKTAKSSEGVQVDANVHERLSFQMMQYLEVATRYTKCSLMVMANGAFIRYRNKYHVNFHVQADRLTNFAWFSMEHACTATEYTRFLSGLLSWLFEGAPRTTRSNR
jgi:hypothetical protein